MVDETLPIPGFAQAWGDSIFQCPYCHGWEARGVRWGYLATKEGLQHGFPAMLRTWSPDVVVFRTEDFSFSDNDLQQMRQWGVRAEESALRSLVVTDSRLSAAELADGSRVELSVLFAHPPQRQVDIVRALELATNETGYVEVNEMTRQTSRPGIYAAGDLTSRAQAAVFAAATGAQAGSMVNYDLALS